MTTTQTSATLAAARSRAARNLRRLAPAASRPPRSAGLQVLPADNPGKLYQLILILVCLSRISERETMVGHGEVVAVADAAAGGDPCESELVAALRSAMDRKKFKALLAEQYKTMTGEHINAVKAAQAQGSAP